MRKKNIDKENNFSDIGLEDFEPRVINQLLEFTYRYVTTILEDAK